MKIDKHTAIKITEKELKTLLLKVVESASGEDANPSDINLRFTEPEKNVSDTTTDRVVLVVSFSHTCSADVV